MPDTSDTARSGRSGATVPHADAARLRMVTELEHDEIRSTL